MATWKNCMPSGMLLRSAWEETSLSAPEAVGTIDEWVRATGGPREEPIPLDLFLRYSAWFVERFVPDRDPSDVALITPIRDGYRLLTKAGDTVDAERIVVAVGVMPFAYVPPPLARLFGGTVGLSTGRIDDVERHRGRRVLVVGGGQAGLETAGLAAQAGAYVQLVTRSQVRWFSDHEPDRPRGPVRRRIYRLAYPAVGYGPPPLNRLVLHPDAFAALPSGMRRKLTQRLLRPGGSPWLRPLVEANVQISERCTVTAAEKTSEGLTVDMSDGSRREVDEVLIACGYRFDIDRLSFLAPELRSRIAVKNGWPVLDRAFRATDQGVHFVGYPAEGRFGPISRFVLGTEFAARRVAEAAHSRPMPTLQ